MFESNAVVHRQRRLGRDVALASAAVYKAMFEEEGSYPATFQVGAPTSLPNTLPTSLPTPLRPLFFPQPRTHRSCT